MTTGIVTKHLIEQQIPYHIRESNPLFTRFLEYYYEFQQQSNITAIIQDIKRYNDIDEVEEQFLLDFFEEFKSIPYTVVADKRLVAKHVYDLYKSKGSEQSLRLLFRIVYGEEIAVYYPQEDILRASDGRWIQDSTITARTISGEIKPTSNKIELITSQGTYIFEIKNYEVFSTNAIHIVFEPRQQYYVDQNQKINVYTNDTLDFVGEATLMPISIDVEDGGAYWQLGQVIVLPGPIRDTICQVKRVGENGSIRKLDIIQYGLGYTSDTTYSVSPFVFKPASSYTEAYTEKISDFPPAYKHNLSIFDINEDVTESIIGFMTDQEYVLDGYVLNGYISRTVFSQSYADSSVSEIVNEEITIDQWIESKARLQLRVGYAARAGGYYEDVRGQPSAPSIRLQDNFYYQLFSYVITTSKLLSEYKNVLSLIHPAGVKYFSNLAKNISINVDVTASRVLSRDVSQIDSTVSAIDNVLREQILPTLNNYVLATTSNIADSYDVHNGLPDSDADVVIGTPIYTAGDYDSGQFDIEDPNFFEYDKPSEVEWDESMIYDGIYTAGDYDASLYDVPDAKYIDPYTFEDDDIDITKT